MRFETATLRLRDVLVALTLLAGCSEVLGLEDGRDQGPCETNAECAPGYECRAKVCTLCKSGSSCDDVSSGGSASVGGKGSAGTAASSAGSTTTMGEGGDGSLGGAGGEPTQGGSSGAGAAGTGGRPISLPPLPF